VRAIIFANGDLGDPVWARRQFQPGDLIVCADGGLRHARTLGLSPHAIVGDLDSLDIDEREQLATANCQLLAYPTRKNETDLELALLYAVERGATEITVLGAVGDRLDQTLANVLLLAHPALADVKVRLVVGATTAQAVRGGQECLLHGVSGDTVSLLPLRGNVTGITTTGLEYGLDNGTLYFALARGVSNVMTAAEARLRVGEGVLLVIHSHQKCET